MRLPSKFNGYSVDGVRLYNDPATRAEQQQKAQPKAPVIGATEIAELTANYNARAKELNTDFTNRLNELNKNFTANRRQTVIDLNAELARMRAEHSQAVKNEDAELRSIKDRAEKTARQRDINAERLARTNAINNFQQKELPARLKAMDDEVAQARKDINAEKTTVLKDLTTAFNDTKAYIPLALQRGESPSLDMITNKQRKQAQEEQAARARADAEARAKAEAQARAQVEAAKQAQVQQYAKEAQQLAQQRKGQNYAQMYNLLTSNMPIPVGYAQPATSQQARTTVIGAGADQGIMQPPQMSPAQIAQMAGMARSAGQPVQQAPEAPQPAKRGGIMRSR
jgi:colicin import membrane protein